MDTLPPAVEAIGLSLRTRGGAVYENITLAVRRRTSLALAGGVNDLSDTLSVHDHVREALALHGERATPVRITAALSAVGLTCDPARKAGSLSAIDRELLGVALAQVYRPRVLIVDDADHDLTPDEQGRLMSALRVIADSGVTVIAACVDPRLAASADVTLAVTIDTVKGVDVDEVA